MTAKRSFGKVRGWLALLGGIAIGLAVGAGLEIYARRSRLRRPCVDGMETTAVGTAQSRLVSMPPMRVAWWLVAGRVSQLAADCRRQPGGRTPVPWVDIGCGTGQLALALAQRMPGAHIVGVDHAVGKLAQARNGAAAAGLAGAVTYESSDAQALPFSDDSVDLVVSTFSLHHWVEPTAVLDEIARILRPGGVFLIVDLRRDMGPLPWLLLWLATRLIVPPALRRIDEPLGSRNAAYTALELARLAQGSALCGWRVTTGPAWLTIEGQHWT